MKASELEELRSYNAMMNEKLKQRDTHQAEEATVVRTNVHANQGPEEALRVEGDAFFSAPTISKQGPKVKSMLEANAQ